jgi:hypothetical protein
METCLSSRLTAAMRHACAFCALVAALGCGDATGPADCRGSNATALEGGSCLVFTDGGLTPSHRAVIERVARETMVAVRRLLPITEVSIRVAAGTATEIPGLGFGGRAPGTDLVLLTVNPQSPLLSQTLPTELFPLLAHELHHVARHRAVGFSANLFEAMILEGLADQFSMEVAGIDPPRWATALNAADLALWLELSRPQWFVANYGHDRWFFGSADVPLWTGYSIGFELTRRYLAAHPTRPASQLYDEPASAFLPADGR